MRRTARACREEWKLPPGGPSRTTAKSASSSPQTPMFLPVSVKRLQSFEAAPAESALPKQVKSKSGVLARSCWLVLVSLRKAE